VVVLQGILLSVQITLAKLTSESATFGGSNRSALPDLHREQDINITLYRI